MHAVQPTESPGTVQTVEPTGRARSTIRVAFCIDNMNVGGTELNALRTARHLVERGVELRVFSMATEGPLLQAYRQLGVPVHFLPLRRLHDDSAVRQGRQLYALVRRHRVQVVHAHDFYSNVFAGPWTRLAGAAFVASRRWWQGPDRRMQRAANRCSYLLANRVVANSAAVARLLEREHVSRRTIAVVPNYVDTDAFEPPPRGWREQVEAELGLPRERLVVGVVASLQPLKDQAAMVRAVAQLAPRWPTLHLVLAGADHGARESIQGLASELAVTGRVIFAGLRPSRPSMHHLFDVSALTSRSEGLPNSILEAMAAGRPVVATDVGAVADVVKEGATGFLVRPGDGPELASCLERLLADPPLRERLGSAGRAWVAEHHSADAAIQRLLGLYASLIPAFRS